MDFFQSDGSSSEATGSNDVKKPAQAGFFVPTASMVMSLRPYPVLQ